MFRKSATAGPNPPIRRNPKPDINLKALEFHIESQDFFGTLATILSLNIQLQENLLRLNQEVTGFDVIKSVTQEVIKNLMYLQENYKIEKK